MACSKVEDRYGSGDLYFLPTSGGSPDFLAALRSHYPKSQAPPPGRKILFRVLERYTHRAWIGFGEPPFKLRARRRLGLENARPLPGTTCCYIYKADRGVLLASAILKKVHPIASAEWARLYDEEIIHWETLVDPTKITSVVPGACFRRAGYRSLGMTTGVEVNRLNGKRVFTQGGSKKLVLYRGPLPRLPKSV